MVRKRIEGAKSISDNQCLSDRHRNTFTYQRMIYLLLALKRNDLFLLLLSVMYDVSIGTVKVTLLDVDQLHIFFFNLFKNKPKVEAVIEL